MCVCAHIYQQKQYYLYNYIKICMHAKLFLEGITDDGWYVAMSYVYGH